MIIEISGVGFHNMGAELMLVAAHDQLRSWPPVTGTAVGCRIGSRAQRRQVGSAAILRLDGYRHPWASRITAIGAALVPDGLLGVVDLCKPGRVSALVDASGFAFGDQWGPGPSRQMGRLFGSYARLGRPVVLLPQAFGPFQEPAVAEAARNALDHADLIFARDADSKSYLSGLGLRKPVIEMAPDFTNLVEPVAERFESPTVIIIPNARMTDMAPPVPVSDYLAFLHSCTAAALGADRRVLVMAHEAMDREIALRLCDDYGQGVEFYPIADPVHAKALVGGADLVVSSRYHGLVNALSMGVPAVGTSWSHKYAHLLADYGCKDSLWDVGDPVSTERRLGAWLSEAELAARRESLRVPADTLKEASRVMWSRVREVVTG